MLNPETVRRTAGRPVPLGVLAVDEALVERIYHRLVPELDGDVPQGVIRIGNESQFDQVVVGFSESGVPHPSHFHTFDPIDPDGSVGTLLDSHEEHQIALANRYPGLRRAVSQRLIRKISKENALIAIATAMPNVVPSLLTIPWALGEFASDSAALTANQVRLSLLLAAVHGREVGYDRQTLQIGSVLGAAFGWRALARQLVSKVPAGGGLISKGMVAFAGTYVVGSALEYWFREQELLDKETKENLFQASWEGSRETVERLLTTVRSKAGWVGGTA